jgi:PH domain
MFPRGRVLLGSEDTCQNLGVDSNMNLDTGSSSGTNGSNIEPLLGSRRSRTVPFLSASTTTTTTTDAAAAVPAAARSVSFFPVENASEEQKDEYNDETMNESIDRGDDVGMSSYLISRCPAQQTAPTTPTATAQNPSSTGTMIQQPQQQSFSTLMNDFASSNNPASSSLEDLVLSDEDLDVSFLESAILEGNEEEEDEDEEDNDTADNLSQSHPDWDTVGAFHNSMEHRSSINTASVFSINTTSIFSTNQSSSTGSTEHMAHNNHTTHNNTHRNNNPFGWNDANAVAFLDQDDTTTSYNTDETGYADDESEQTSVWSSAVVPPASSKSVSALPFPLPLQSPPPPPPVRDHRHVGLGRPLPPPLSPTTATGGGGATMTLSSSHSPIVAGILRAAQGPSSSSFSPPSQLPMIPAQPPTHPTATTAVVATSVIPTSASLFRYLRSWGSGGGSGGGGRTSTSEAAASAMNANGTERPEPEHVAAALLPLLHSGGGGTYPTTLPQSYSMTMGEGELTSDDDDDEISLGSHEEAASWNAEDEASETCDGNEHVNATWQVALDWNALPMIPNRFCVAVPKPTPAPTTTPNSTATGSAEASAAAVDPVTDPPLADGGGSGTPLTHPTNQHDHHHQLPPPPLHYLDASLLHQESVLTVKEANEFVWEHGTLLQAVLQLLAERDQVGVEGSTDSTENIWKKGPLKKLSFAVGRRKHQRPEVAGAWKVKYMELRQGNLCYYEDSARTGRKTIHLRQADAVVQESSYRGPGFVFELLVQGSPTRYWMASSEVERQAWIKAIQAAMIGNEAPRKHLDLQPYEESLKVYTSLRESLQQADSQPLYLAAIQAAMKELASLQVPVQWVQDRIENDLSPLLLGTLKPPKFGRSPQKQLKLSIAEFWKNMARTTFSINGLTVPRHSQLASERVVGALTRCILEFDKAFASDDTNESSADATPTHISELQAVSYARHILLAVLRSKERQDTSFVARYLLENPGVIVIEQCPSEDVENQVNMEVSFAGEDLPDEFLHSEISTWVWIRTRRKNQSAIAATVSTTMFKHRHTFAVLSGTVLSYYAAASPRPHGLRGQLVLTATSSVRDEGEEIAHETGDGNGNTKNNGVRYVLCITSESHQDRLLSFESQVDAAAWKEAIQLAIDSAGSLQHPPRVVTTTTTTPLMAPAKMLKGAERVIKVAADGTIQSGIRVIKGAKDGGIRVIKGAKDGGIRVIKTATGSGFKVIRGAVSMLRHHKNSDTERTRRRPSLQMLLNNTIVHGKREPTVQCVFQTTQTYIIRDHSYTEHDSEQGTESGRGSRVEDGWISVQAKLYQAFLMSGGPSGRIARGDALVELVFVETKVEPDDDASC